VELERPKPLNDEFLFSEAHNGRLWFYVQDWEQRRRRQIAGADEGVFCAEPVLDGSQRFLSPGAIPQTVAHKHENEHKLARGNKILPHYLTLTFTTTGNTRAHCRR
jgi:hypothetical protein